MSLVYGYACSWLYMNMFLRLNDGASVGLTRRVVQANIYTNRWATKVRKRVDVWRAMEHNRWLAEDVSSETYTLHIMRACS